VQLVSASSPSHQVLGSKPSLCRISAGVRLCFGYSLPQTPLVWEPLALGLPFLDWLCEIQRTVHKSNKRTVCFRVACSMVKFNTKSVILHISSGVGAL
jgi:hypothetical protein